MPHHHEYSVETIHDIIRLRRRLDKSSVPPRRTDHNVIIGTWNIRHLGSLYPEWGENEGSPKRNLRALAIIAEIIRCFDVVAIQEVKRDTRALRVLLDDFLGPNWAAILSDVSGGSKGNTERLAYVFDQRRVTPSGLAGEIVLPPSVHLSDGGETRTLIPAEQFDRTPYIVGFRAAQERFALLTVHIRYGENEQDRLNEVRSLAQYVAREIRDRARFEGAEETNLILLGDFNINERTEHNILFQELLNVGLWVPQAIRETRTTYGTRAKHYDQIAWFRDDLTLLGGDRAGSIDFTGAVYPEISLKQMSFRVSDHFPLWVEFLTDRSNESMAQVLDLDPMNPDPFAHITE
ncbi:MAG: endonuclease/exonuclease/phosphatase family protein [Chloroflexi bacterium]|nr:endonuclease/exonuclease/phosphatase family protein [Chloroflexota bacterium]